MKQWKGYEHGINFGGWLSQCVHTKEHYDSFISDEDFKTVREWGLDHIRIPVDYELFEDEHNNFQEEGFAYIAYAIRMCRDNGLNMILDLHRTPGYSFDNAYGEFGFFEEERYQEHFYKIWEEFAKRFGGEKDMLAFELLNEVTKKEYCDRWNRIAETCIKKIRAVAPDISILVGGYYNNSVEAVKDLAMPYDENIIYNFHCYDPLLFTHQGAPWIPPMDTAFRCPFEMSYAEYEKGSKELLKMENISFGRFGTAQDVPGEKYFELLFEEAIKAATERNVALYCGEYGVIDRVDPKEALKWYKAFHKVMKHYQIGSAAWSYRRMDFGLSDARMDEVREELLSIIKWQ